MEHLACGGGIYSRSTGARIGIIVLDSFWLGLRIPTLAEDTLLANTLAIIFSLILLIISLRQFAGFTLRTKLLILSLGTGIVSIVLVSLVVITNTQRTLTQKTQDSLVSSARRAMNDVDDFLREFRSLFFHYGKLNLALNFLKNNNVDLLFSEWMFQSNYVPPDLQSFYSLYSNAPIPVQ